MRFSALLALFLAAHVVAQTTTEPGPDPEPTPSVEPDPEPAPGPSTRPPTSDPPTTFSDPEPSTTITDPATTDPTGTATTVPPTTTGTATAPVGGGSNCVQSCLSEAAAAAGCSSSADFGCVCGSGSYLSTARQCFTRDNCPASDTQSAEGDYRSACSSTSESTRSPATRPPATTIPGPTRTQTYTGSLTSLTTQTLVLTSGAVVTLSGDRATTITSAFTTIRTGQVGDFAGAGSGVAPNNNGALGSVNWGPWGGIGMVGLGVVGGMVVLVV